MTSLTPPRVRSVLVSAVALLLLSGAVGCDAGADIESADAQPPAGERAVDVPPVPTLVTLQHIGDRLDATRRQRVKAKVTETVDSFFDGAYLGEFPRTDFGAGFSRFTRDAAADAQRDLDVMSSAALSDQVDSITATKRRVTVDVFAYQGHPRGATARFFLDFDTSGDLEASMRIRGELYLTKVKGRFMVFGYDIDQAEQR